MSNKAYGKYKVMQGEKYWNIYFRPSKVLQGNLWRLYTYKTAFLNFTLSSWGFICSATSEFKEGQHL